MATEIRAGLTDEEAARARAEAEEANAYVQVTEVHVPTEQESDQATMVAAESAEPPSSSQRVLTFSSGVRLRLRPVAPLFVRRAQMQLKKPTPPLWENPNNGRQEYNEADPEYLEAMRVYDEETETAAIRALILSGSALEYCPPDIPAPDSDEWVENALEAGITYAFKTERGRYATWVEDVALANREDFYALGMAVGRLTGIAEEDMARALDAFRSPGERPVTQQPDVRAVDSDGHNLPADAGGTGAGD